MEIGLRIPHTGRQATPDFVRRWSMDADRLGYDSLWGVDHLVMPQKAKSRYVLPRRPADIADDSVSGLLSPNFELMTTLAFVAAVTERILLGTDEHIALLRAIWSEPSDHVEFHGEFWDVPPMDPEPRPAQPTIPILVGGHSEVAIERAARLGDGWIAAGMSADRLGELLPILHAALDRHGRSRDDVPVYCGARAKDATVDGLRRDEDLGVRSMQVGLGTLDDLERFADEVLPAFR